MFGVPFLSGEFIQGDLKFSEEEYNLSLRMMRHWADFARFGNPGWAESTSDQKLKMVFDETDSIQSSKDDFELHGRLKLFEVIYKTPKRFSVQ